MWVENIISCTRVLKDQGSLPERKLLSRNLIAVIKTNVKSLDKTSHQVPFLILTEICREVTSAVVAVIRFKATLNENIFHVENS